ncbi:MAG TPA: hypothetical protein VFE51_23780 [Verrucomicrobiae bacterium]|nr:hypothetical protein [Verrucomicrobiae bacterium]
MFLSNAVPNVNQIFVFFHPQITVVSGSFEGLVQQKNAGSTSPIKQRGSLS